MCDDERHVSRLRTVVGAAGAVKGVELNEIKYQRPIAQQHIVFCSGRE